ncbi:hypothetical protein [Streptomyces tremellae]|uniref:hypothetical protein n=1 Tax=Streptomyces tremellae TaxID=1124239 RepID=UPI0031E76671
MLPHRAVRRAVRALDGRRGVAGDGRARRLRRVEVEPSVLSAQAAAVGAASTIFHATFAPRLRGR